MNPKKSTESVRLADAFSGLRAQSSDESAGEEPVGKEVKAMSVVRDSEPVQPGSVRNRFQQVPWEGEKKVPVLRAPEDSATETSVRERFRFIPWEPSEAQGLEDEEAKELALRNSQEISVRNFFSKMK